LTTAVQRGPAHDAIACYLGCDPELFKTALDRTFVMRAARRTGSPQATLRWLAAEQGANPSDERVALAMLARIAAVAADVRVRPEAALVLRQLRRSGYRIGLVSDCWYELPIFFPKLPIAPLLMATTYSWQVGWGKPAPQIYHAACGQLGVRPEQCLYVGDGGSRELTGARQVGMTAVRLASEDLAGHLVFEPEAAWDGATVHGLTELLQLTRHPELV
jgi:putative hydrolase of the HAD superfamily